MHNVPPYVSTHLKQLINAVMHKIVSGDRLHGVNDNIILATD